MKKKVLISTGGSGGHVVPGTIFYEHLKDKFDICITTDCRGIKFIDKDKYNIRILDVTRISKNFFLIIFQIFLIFNSILKALLILKKSKIEIVISTGGYMSLPLCMASKFLNIKLYLFEPNMVLGRANKFFIGSCVKIFCYSDKIKNFPKKFRNKIYLIPPLLRKEFYSAKIVENIDEQINLLIIGGSQGATLFDTIIADTIIHLSKRYKLRIFHQTSLNNFNNLKNFYLKNNIESELFDFNEDILNFMCKSNFCITRAGASTLAELIFLNIPHIAIPLPSAKDNHQFENASMYYQLGCNWILDQKEINSQLTGKLTYIIENKEEYLDKKKNMKNFSYENTWNNINQKIITIINEN